jgi:predicted transcriptional regulator
MQYRGRIDIFAEILYIANGGATRSKLMNGANLSPVQLDELSDKLMHSSLLEYSHADRKFRTTEKGFQLLDDYSELNSISGNKARFDDLRLYR